MTTSTARHWPDIYPLATGWRAQCACGCTGQHFGHSDRSTAVTVHRVHRASVLGRAPAARSSAARTARRRSVT
jgi:hypothetical protein